MYIMKAKGLLKEWNGKKLFEGIDLEIREGEHLALFGVNGVGKTTLMKALLGRVALDGGAIQRLLPLSEWGSLRQGLDEANNVTTLEFVQGGTPDQLQAKRRLEQLQDELGACSSSGSGADAELLEQYDFAYEQYALMDGYDWEVKVEKSLQRLKLEPSLWHVPVRQLSGGQQTKAQIARLMVAEPKFLLLDEPTNHLDRETLEWLEEWIRTYAGAVLIVSHDRTFLDRVADGICEMTPTGSKMYRGGYSDYRRQKELELRTQQAQYEKEEKQREELLESIRRYRQWFQTAHGDAFKVEDPNTKAFWIARSNKHTARLRAKEKELERLEQNRVEQPRSQPQLHTRFGSGEISATTLLTMDGVSFAYGADNERAKSSGYGPEAPQDEPKVEVAQQKPLFSKLNLSVERGDRMAVLGPNGAGKTTLLKLMLGILPPTEGTVRHNPRLKPGYFSQQFELLGQWRDETLLDTILRLPNMTQTFARTLLGSFLFSRDDVFKKVGDLSMGEKCRIAFLQLYCSDANLLVLDEPTNYLDIDSRERMEEAFADYPGAIVLVSHDRYLVGKIANRIVGVQDDRVIQYPGTYAEYMAHLERGDITPEQLQHANELQRLELELAQYMSQEASGDPQTDAELIEKIKALRQRIGSMSSVR